MNISSAKFEEDFCKICLVHDRHKKEEHHDGSELTCSECEKWRYHKNDVDIAQRHFQENCKSHAKLASMQYSKSQGIFGFLFL